MSLRKAALRIASELPQGDPTRREILSALKAAGEDTSPLAVGDILVSSWGYDQTNIDFYEVLAVTPKMATIRRMEKKVIRQSGTNEYVMPVPGRYRDKAIRRKIKEGWRGGVWISINSYAGAHKWDGKPEAQTNSLYGH